MKIKIHGQDVSEDTQGIFINMLLQLLSDKGMGEEVIKFLKICKIKYEVSEE